MSNKDGQKQNQGAEGSTPLAELVHEEIQKALKTEREAQAAERLESQKTILELKSQLESHQTKLSELSNPNTLKNGTHVVSHEEYVNFLSEPRPDDEFFVLNPYQQLCVQAEKNIPNPITGQTDYTPPIILTFEHFFGPGSDLKDASGKKLFPRGVGRRRICLEEWPELAQFGNIDLNQIKARILNANTGNSAEERILTGNDYADMVRDEFEDRERKRKRDQVLEDKRTAILTGQASGNPRFAGGSDN